MKWAETVFDGVWAWQELLCLKKCFSFQRHMCRNRPLGFQGCHAHCLTRNEANHRSMFFDVAWAVSQCRNQLVNARFCTIIRVSKLYHVSLVKRWIFLAVGEISLTWRLVGSRVSVLYQSQRLPAEVDQPHEQNEYRTKTCQNYIGLRQGNWRWIQERSEILLSRQIRLNGFWYLTVSPIFLQNRESSPLLLRSS